MPTLGKECISASTQEVLPFDAALYHAWNPHFVAAVSLSFSNT